LAAPSLHRQFYNGPNLRDALAKFGEWTIEIVKRAADAAGFQLLPRRWVVDRTFAWLNRNRRLAKDFEASIASAKAWVYIASVQLLVGDCPAHSTTYEIKIRTISGKDDLYTIQMPVIQRNKEGHLTGGRRATTQDFVLEVLREKLEKHTPQPFRSDISRGEGIDALRTLCAFLMV
jgi:hypothetical protein